MDDYNIASLISEEFVLFVAATTGQGAMVLALLLMQFEPHHHRLCVCTLCFNHASLPNWATFFRPGLTTTTGVEPDNMQRFWRFLLRRSLPVSRQSVDFTAFLEYDLPSCCIPFALILLLSSSV